MAIDNKYGRVELECGDIGDDEPVFVFRAQDILLTKVLAYYLALCVKSGSPRRHIDLILDSCEIVRCWQKKYRTKIPSSDGRARQ